ncbi:protein eva-1 homolog C isoform X1 [Rhincodon typus]|uniref:protein eva-1 homolog C isoform X1 n=1 Tax=Rhincodon typus TaxID=259920 RepID=UPI00202FDA8A|nr:protein eva-1 homolog C isoform X1 [Rhincodon typus]XP_048459226.1 protein eva-1 homolog C isoform X1 [Rhincodon typus]XP_048459227.1 protein eva-1 homolog C isoform X1 [Rhincodon typus]
MHLLDGCHRRQIPVLLSMIYLILGSTKEMGASGIFSDYLSKVLRRHTEQACDGAHLNLYCPRDTTISIQSAFYGRKVPSSLLCPGLQPRSRAEENLNCTAPTTLQKILDECQDQQSCQLLVNRRVFGLDPCPGTSKYLLVSYKCKPNKYKSKVACEGKELKLRCKNSTLINIYSATYGRMMNGDKACPSNHKLPNIECLSHTALEVVSTTCYGKQNCKIIASSHYFGDPCFPGMQKYLSVIYVCVSKLLLQEADPNFSGLAPSWVYNENANKSLGPQENSFSLKEGKIVISTLVTFAYIKNNPEMVGLLFISSVCIGLIFTLCVLVIRVSCRPDLQKICNKNSDDRKVDCCQDEGGNEGNSNDDEDESSDDNEESSLDFTFEGLTKFYSMTGSNNTEAAEMAERIERRDRIIQEIWMNGGSELPVIRNLNQYY